MTTLIDLAPSIVVRDLGTSYALSHAPYVAAALGVADLLADGPRSSAELADLTGTHAPSLYLVLDCCPAQAIFRSAMMACSN